MQRSVLFEISNDGDRDITIDLEPVPRSHTLRPRESVEVVALTSSATVPLIRVNTTLSDGPVIALWPEQFNVALHQNGKDVFEE